MKKLVVESDDIFYDEENDCYYTWATAVPLTEDPDVLEEFDWEKIQQELEDLQADGDDTLAGHIDDPGSTSGQVYHPASNEWPAVINSANHTLSIKEISHTDVSVEWDCLVSTGNTVRFESFSISSPLPLPVVGCFAYSTADGWKDSPEGFLAVNLKELGRDVLDTGTTDLELNRLTDELCFITIQILEGRYKGTHGRHV